MKNRSTGISVALVSMTMGVFCFGALWSFGAEAQTPAAAPETTPASVPAAPALQSGVREVVKMYQAGINKEIIINYIKSTALPYHLDADGIIYLHSVGVPPEITQALISRNGEIQQLNAQNWQQQQMATANDAAMNAGNPTGEQTPVVTPTTPPPDLSDYGYAYPYYDAYYVWPGYYGAYWWPGVGWGWGHRWGYGSGFRGSYGAFHRGVGGYRSAVGGFRGGAGGFRAGGGGFHGGGGGFHGGFGGAHGGVGGHGGGGHR